MGGIRLIRLRIAIIESPCECDIEPPSSISQIVNQSSSLSGTINFRHVLLAFFEGPDCGFFGESGMFPICV